MNRFEKYQKLLENEVLYKEYIHKYNIKDTASTIDCIYAYVFVPALTEYVTWVLAKAKEDGIKRLYFLARDGYMMYITASHICARLKLDIDCRYLKISRYAARVPEYHLLGRGCIDRIVTGGIDMTLRKILTRTGMSQEQIREVVIDAGLIKKSEKENESVLLDTILNYNEVMNIKKKLQGSELFFKYTMQASQTAYNAAIMYFRQQGLMDDMRMALVDSGWIGTLQESVNNLIHSAGAVNNVCGYYFGMYDIPKDADKAMYNAFYFTPAGNMKYKVNFSNSLYEAVITDYCGMTHHYEECGGEISVIEDLKANPNKDFIIRNIATLESILESSSDEAIRIKYERDLNSTADRELLYKLFKMFMGRPTQQEVEAYGSLLFSDDILEGHLQTVAAELSYEDIKRQRFISKLLIMTGLKKGTIRESAWIEGSIVSSGRHIGASLWHARIYKYFIYIRKLLKLLIVK